MKIEVDVAVLGGGAAGLMCAMRAGERGRRVVVVDHANRLGQKLLISGGGKCNFSNRRCTAEHYVGSNPHFCKSALAGFGCEDVLTMLEEHGIAYEQREHGQLFCKHSASQIVQMFETMCRQNNVQLLLKHDIQSVEKKAQGFEVTTGHGLIVSSSLVVATGGLSYPQAGASDLGHRLARQFDIAVTPCRAGLVPLLYSRRDKAFLGELTGISVPAVVSSGRSRFEESVLFTHQSLSGPAMLQISNHWSNSQPITIDWLAGVDVYELLLARKQQKGAATVQSTLAGKLPHRMIQVWSRYFPNKPLAECSREQLQTAADSMNRWPFDPAGDEGYRKAEVTLGGVDTKALSSKTMECKSVPGLYFIGEVTDVTGQLGGYNLQWAWSSGYAAGSAV